ncbi:MAG: exodeoxyribonuclease-3 [Cyclobacteriaceae bacterium]|jgi:exodeoxyribonuclease-3
MHIVSWNVNGIRAIMKKDFLKDFEEMNPDILCLQETKAQVEDAAKALAPLEGYHIYLNSSKARKGYSGTAIITKKEPIEVTYDMGIEEHDQEGRVITAEYPDFFLVTVYTPNSGEGLKRLDYRSTWDEAFMNHIAILNEQKPVIVCGDLNVAHHEIDIARPSANFNKTSGYTQTEIDGLDEVLEVGFTDTFRHIYPEEVKYSWWSYRFKSRDKNIGWRIDYFLISDELTENLEDSMIYNDRFGSDHCPIAIKINF